MQSQDSTPLLDYAHLEPFIDIGLTDFLDILSDVIRELPCQLEQIRTAIAQGDHATFKTRAHSLRGMLANFGCLRLTTVLLQLEHGGMIQAERADAIHAELETLWQQSLTAIKVWEKFALQAEP